VAAASLYYLGTSVVQLSLALYFATMLSFSTRFRNFSRASCFDAAALARSCAAARTRRVGARLGRSG
jgi:hypothetical protein